MWTSVSSCCQSSSAGPSLRRPNDNLQYPLLLLRIHLLYSTGVATPTTSTSFKPTPAVVPRRSSLAEPAVSSPLRSCPPFDYVIPRATPPNPNPLIIFTRRSDSPAPGGPIPFTFHYELAAILAIEPAAFFSSCLCRGHLHPRHLVSVLPDRRRCLLSVTGRSLSMCICLSLLLFSRSRYSILVVGACAARDDYRMEAVSRNFRVRPERRPRVIRTKGEGLSSSITAPQGWLNCSTIVVASYVTSVLLFAVGLSLIFRSFPFVQLLPFNDTAHGKL